jgi:hypothetical protein
VEELLWKKLSKQLENWYPTWLPILNNLFNRPLNTSIKHVSEVNSSNFKQTLDTLISLVCCLVTCNSQVKTCAIYMMQRHDIDSCLTFQDDSTNQVFFFFGTLQIKLILWKWTHTHNTSMIPILILLDGGIIPTWDIEIKKVVLHHKIKVVTKDIPNILLVCLRMC